MNLARKSLMCAAFLSAGMASVATSAQAQTTTPPAAAVTPAVSPADAIKQRVPAMKFTQRPAQEIAARLSKASGVLIATDSTVAGAPVTFSTVGGTLDVVLPQFAAALPKGTTLRATLLPKMSPMPEADAIAAYLAAQDGLKAKLAVSTAALTTPAAPTRQTVLELEALGRTVSGEKASAVSAALDLVPVVLVSVPRASLDAVGKMATMQTEGMRYYQGLSAEQKKQFLNQQFDNFFNMTPQDRQAFVGQMMQQGVVMMEKMNTMSPDQKAAFQKEMMQAVQASGLPMGPGGGAPGGK